MQESHTEVLVCTAIGITYDPFVIPRYPSKQG